MPTVSARGLRFHVQDLHPPGAEPNAARPAVVMLHGLVIDNLSSYWYTVANPLATACDVYLYDQRGHGLSEVADDGYSVASHTDDLEALIDLWGLRDRPVHLVGNSFGGVLALTYADRHPDQVASLFLIEAHFGIEGWGEHMAGSLALAAFGLDDDAVKEWLATEGGRRVKRLARHSDRLFEQTTLIADLQAEQPYPVAALEAVRCPTMAVYGEGSDILDRARDLERLVPGCELQILADATHSVLTERTPAVRHLLLDWIARHGHVTFPADVLGAGPT